MKQTRPVDYLAAVGQFRQQEHSGKNLIHDPSFIVTRSDEPVDYPAFMLHITWKKTQAGKMSYILLNPRMKEKYEFKRDHKTYDP